jgi:hypothetical protein
MSVFERFWNFMVSTERPILLYIDIPRVAVFCILRNYNKTRLYSSEHFSMERAGFAVHVVDPVYSYHNCDKNGRSAE